MKNISFQNKILEYFITSGLLNQMLKAKLFRKRLINVAILKLRAFISPFQQSAETSHKYKNRRISHIQLTKKFLS